MEQATTLIIVGITGDLAQRKLIPAIAALRKHGELPARFHIIGVSRRPVSVAEIYASVADPDDHTFLRDHTTMVQLDMSNAADFGSLATQLEKTDGDATRLFYLSIPPETVPDVISHLAHSGLAGSDAKLLLEKPFGTDYDSAKKLITHIDSLFDESQIYRIDHYTAKPMSGELIDFKQHHSDLWQHISAVDIVASETITIEDRANFYEQTGALRDIVQNHLLQLAALTLMSPHATASVPARRLAALEQFRPADPTAAIRAQYDGYREAVNNPASTTETFVSMQLTYGDHALPVRLTTGKALDEKRTEITLHARDYRLIVRYQPDPAIERIEQDGRRTVFPLASPGTTSRDGYEIVLAAAIAGDHTVFTTSDELIAAWRIAQPVIDAWAHSGDGLRYYPVGSSISHIVQS